MEKGEVQTVWGPRNLGNQGRIQGRPCFAGAPCKTTTELEAVATHQFTEAPAPLRVFLGGH